MQRVITRKFEIQHVLLGDNGHTPRVAGERSAFSRGRETSQQMTLTLVLVCMAFLVLATPLYALIAVFSFVDNMVGEALPVQVTSG